jgi:hypothetical protein
MTALAQYIAQFVEEYARRYADGSGDLHREARLVFLGPPLEVLEQVYACLTSPKPNGPGPRVALPVLLQVPKDRLASGNPPVGESGWCDQSHLLTVRDTASAPSFLALIPPDQPMDLSIQSAADLFGVGQRASGRLAAFELWWADPFVQLLVDHAIKSTGLETSRTHSIKLIEAAAKAEDQLDLERQARIGAWRVLSRVMGGEHTFTPASAATRLAAACGVPPTDAGDVQPDLQLKALDAVASAFEDGFKAGIESALANSTNDSERRALVDFRAFVEHSCDIPALFQQAPQAYYAPSRGSEFKAPPSWWTTLTADRWLELLEDSRPAKSDVELEVLNPLSRITFGGITIVEDVVQLKVTADTSCEATLERRVGTGAKGLTQWPLPLGPHASTSSCDVPAHKSPVRFNVIAQSGTSLAGLKVISLATWEPGVHVQSRTAEKVTPATRSKARGPHKRGVECSVVLQGPGRHLLDIYVSPGRELPDLAVLRMQDGPGGVAEEISCGLHRVKQHQYAIEVDASGDCELEFTFTDHSSGNPVQEPCKVQLTCAEVRVTGCSSEFDRLVREHRGGKRTAVQVDRVARSSVLEAWTLDADNCRVSWQPAVLATDYAQVWAPPSWGGEHGPLFSEARFISDPRPSWDELTPPDAFIEARQDVFKRIRGEDGSALTAEAQLGHWINTDTEFGVLVERYLDEYMVWLSDDPDGACWVDVVAVASIEHGTDTLSPRLDAILLPPIHPLRLAWLCGAQSVLLDALQRAMPCPAAALLDADVVPDIFVLSCRGPDGIEPQTFVAVECSSDYWSVLWNGDRLRELAMRAQKAPFGPELGITVGGLARGFSPSQVAKALGDVSDLLSAKPIVSASLSSSGVALDSCNEGIADWSRRRFSSDRLQASRDYLRIGPKMLEVRDARPEAAWPDEPSLSNLVEDTGGAVRWFLGGKSGNPVDLAVITQLEAADPALSAATERSAIGPGALLRHRIRRQLPRGGQSYLVESRQAGTLPERTGSTLLDKVAHAVVKIENSPRTRLGFRFSPDIQAIRNAFQNERADFVAVSSSAVDPSCFVGEWMQGAYLWDYSLPSYSQRAGDTAGTYLISRIKDTDREAMRAAVAQLPGGETASNEQLDGLLSEVARRGIPTVRELSGDDTKAAGALGMFVAARILQDAFRTEGDSDGLLDVQRHSADGTIITVVVPVDPFKTHLEELAHAIKPTKELSGRRPDLLILTLEVGAISTRVRVVPVEVKFRTGAPLSKEECLSALAQARSLSLMLGEVVARAADAAVWRLALCHLLVSMVSFGMRIYGQSKNIVQAPREWTDIHERAASSILGGSASIEIDDTGRLVAVDSGGGSGPYDRDGDGFAETIVICREDAARVMVGDAAGLYGVMRAHLGDWNTIPSGSAEQKRPYPTTGASPVPQHGPAPNIDALLTPTAAAPKVTPVGGTTPSPPDRVAEPDAIAATWGPTLANHIRGPEDDLGIILRLGSTTGQFEVAQVELNISDTRLNQLNIGVVGDLGTGKTQLLKSLIAQIVSSAESNRGIKPRFLIFDYKKDYSAPEFVEAVGAKVVKPFRMPLNIFDTSGMVDSNVPWLERFKFFADVLDKIFQGIGPVQRDKLKQAVKAAYDVADAAGRMPTVYDVRAEYHSILAGKSDAPLAIIDDMVDAEVFSKDPPTGSSFGTFFDGVVVVSLASLGQDDRSKNMVVAMLLNMFYEHMLGIPKRPFLGQDPQLRAIDSYLLVDEADNIMRYEFDVLRRLLLQGREFGVGVILASQYLRHFKVNGTDYRDPLLSWFVHKVPNVTAAELGGLGLTTDLAELAERVKTLPNHHCLYKSFRTQAMVIRGLPFFELNAKAQ